MYIITPKDQMSAVSCNRPRAPRDHVARNLPAPTSIARRENSGHAKVDQDHVREVAFFFAPKHDVLGLDVTMGDPHVVEVLYAQDHSPHDPRGISL